MAARIAAVRAGEGVSSMIFWCLRWIEHSRSPRCAALPWLSQITWISMCRGLRTYLSRYTVASPKADRAACAVLSIAEASSASDSTTFIPMPPPPPDGLSITGKPIQLQVRIGGGRAAYVVSLVGIADVDRVPVGVGIHSGCRNTKLTACSHDADGDLAAVRDENFVEEFFLQPIASSGWFGLTTSP